MNNIIDKNIAEPLYLQLKRWIEASIRSGRFSSGSRIPSENEFSRNCGIHRNTIRKALFLLEEEGLLCSVPGSGWFVSQATKLARQVAFLTLQDADSNKSYSKSEFSLRIKQGLDEGAALYNFQMHRLNAEETTLFLNEKLQNCSFEALVVDTFQNKYLEQLHLLRASKLPLVIFNQQIFGEDIPCVCIDQYYSTRHLVTRLIQNGHRRIGCITVSSESNWRYALERYRGYNDAFTQLGLKTDRKLICQISNTSQHRRRIRDFLRNNPDITALFIAGEIFHKDTLDLLQKRGRCIPEDISVVAFDRVRGEMGKIITALDQPLEEMGVRVFRILDQILAGKSVVSEVLLPNITSGNSIAKLN